MVMSLVVIGIIGLVGYLWSARGVYSAFLHFVCTVLAGAIAFGLWETAAYGVFMGVKQEMAFALGLIVPFLVSLVALRVLVDTVLPKNLDLDDATNFVGGMIFGGLSAAVAAGVLVIGVGFMRLPPAIMGYEPIVYDDKGNLVSKSGLIVPVDRITVGLYEMMSVGAFATGTPLAERLPNAHEQAAASRYTYGGKGRTSLSPADVAVLSRYEVEGTLNLSDAARGDQQPARGMNGESYPASSRVEGYVVQFKSGAKEKDGQIVVSPGTARLVVKTPEGVETLHPVAVVSRSSPSTLDLGRWRFDAKEVFIASVGGASDATFAFEFVVPPGATSRDLYIRNVRTTLPGGEAVKFASVSARDEAIKSRTGLFEGLGKGTVTEAPAAGAPTAAQAGPTVAPIRLSDRLMGVLNRTTRGGLEVDTDNRVVDGQHVFDKKDLSAQGVDVKLRIESFATSSDTYIVQVDVSMNQRTSLFGKAFDAALTAAPPVLVDNLGQQYQAVGYMHDRGNTVEIRFTPGRPLRALSELPTLSQSRAGERLVLLFRPSANVQIVKFQLGSMVVEELNPPITVPQGRDLRKRASQ